MQLSGAIPFGILNIVHNFFAFRRPASVVNPLSLYKVNLDAKIGRNTVKKELYLMRQDNTIYIFSINVSFSSTGQDKSNLQKQISKLIILIATAA